MYSLKLLMMDGETVRNMVNVFDVQGSVHRKYISFDIFPT